MADRRLGIFGRRAQRPAMTRCLQLNRDIPGHHAPDRGSISDMERWVMVCSGTRLSDDRWRRIASATWRYPHLSFRRLYAATTRALAQ